MTPSLQSAWTGLPAEVRDLLLIGSTGKPHLLQAARAAFAAGMVDLWSDLLVSACAEDPLDGDLAMQLAGPAAERGWGGAGLPQALRALASQWRKPDNLGYYQRLAARRDPGRMWAYLEQQTSRLPSLFWVSQTLALSVAENEPERGLTMLDAVCDLSPLLDKPRGDLLLLLGRFDQAAAAFERLGPLFGQAQLDLWLGRVALLAGDLSRARGLLLAAVRRQPWRSSEILRLDEILQGRPAETAEVPGEVALCLYTCNKAGELAATLESLLAADLAQARLFVLDNGSTDNAGQVLDAFQDRFSERMVRIDLPVNVGAAAARNWLASLDEVRAADWVGYLDDDVELPADFLGRFGAAIQRLPGAFVYGCRVADHAAPHLLQSVDYHLRYPEGTDLDALPEADPSQLRPNPFQVCKLHIQTLDWGQFDYLRPCLSVTGCCHLFPAESLRRSEGFSIQLSPSQYDDFEHDLRLAEQGGFAAYQGHLRVLHRKRTGRASHTSVSEEGNALGNFYKLQCAHPKSAILPLLNQDAGRLQADLAQRIHRLDQA
ncbi:MAG: glycosyltransferase family 2 protein [Desulfovibrionaceae bacterium]